jgi:hypothetical protein
VVGAFFSIFFLFYLAIDREKESPEMRVAIIFYGLMRNLKATFPSIQRHIFKSLRRAGIEFDVYLHTYYLEVLSNHRSKEENVPLDNEEWKMLYPKEYLIDYQDEVDKILPHDEFCKLENPWATTDPTRNSMRNLLRQLYSLKRAWSLLENTDGTYDGYLILRPDLQYMNPLEIHRRLPVKPMQVYLPEWGANQKGVNDRICFTSYEGAKTVMNRLDRVMEYGRQKPPHSQIFLKHVLETNHLETRLLPIYGKRVRASKNDDEDTNTDDGADEKTKGWYHKALENFESRTSDAFWALQGPVFQSVDSFDGGLAKNIENAFKENCSLE